MTDRLPMIDPIKVKEARVRVEKINQASDRAIGAAEALAWFSAWIDGKDAVYGIECDLAIKEYLGAHPGGGAAAVYLDKATDLLVKEMVQKVADQAIAMALADLAAGEPK